MPWYRTPDGTAMHLNFGGRNKNAPKACCGKREDGTVCGVIAERLCDWKMPDGRDCDAGICLAHTFSPAADKDLCPKHQVAYQLWLRELGVAY